MSASAAASYGGGMDGDDDKQRKRALPVDAPDLFSENSDDESAPTDKKQKLGLSGKSESFSELTKLLNTRKQETAEMEDKAKEKRRIALHKCEEAITKLDKADRIVAAARARVDELIDQHMAKGNQEEEVDDEDKKATDEDNCGKK